MLKVEFIYVWNECCANGDFIVHFKMLNYNYNLGDLTPIHFPDIKYVFNALFMFPINVTTFSGNVLCVQTLKCFESL